MLNPASIDRKKDSLKQITEDSSSPLSAGRPSPGRNEVKPVSSVFS
jgi:hypothetical protein